MAENAAPTRRLTVAEWSRSLGVSRQAGHQAVKRCAIPVVDGKIDAATATMLYRERTQVRMKAARPAARAASTPAGSGTDRKSAPEQGPAATAVTYSDSRARREHAAAQREELELAKADGRLIEREVAIKAVFEAFRALRDRVMGIPKRGGAYVGLELRELQETLEHDLREALSPDEVTFMASLPWNNVRARKQELQ